jgi:hypothetical protein
MLTVEPFNPQHFERLLARGVQLAQLRQLSPQTVKAAEMHARLGPAYTALEGDRVIACGGVLTAGSPFGTVWAMLAHDSGRHMLYLARAAGRMLEAVAITQRLRRLEATIEEGFEPGCRLVRLLGFEFEGRMRNYGDNGETHLRYARTV